MMNNKFSKNDLLFYYHKREFPKNLILTDTLVHKELLFSEEAIEPEVYTQSKKKIKLTNSFVIEDELEPKKAAFKKGKIPNQKQEHNITKGNAFVNLQNNNWRKNEFEDPGFFDNFKGKSDERQVQTFKRNLDLHSSKENNFYINNSSFTDFLGNNVKVPFNLKIDNSKEITASADDLFNNSESIFMGNKEAKKNQKGNTGSRKNSYQVNERKTSINSSNYLKEDRNSSPFKAKFQSLTKEEKNIVYSQPDPKKVDFRNVDRINKYMNFFKEQPIWYIFHPIAKSSFGPCSSADLEEMYKGGMVDGQSEIRFIDIYNIKNKRPFEFFKLKDLEDVKFIENIEISSLVKSAIVLSQPDINKYDNSNNNSNGNQTNKNNNNNNNSNNNNKNKNKKHRKTSSIANLQNNPEIIENNKDNQIATNAKLNSPNVRHEDKDKQIKPKKEPKDLNSILEKVLNNDIKKQEQIKKVNENTNPKVHEISQKIELTPLITSPIKKEVIETKTIPSIEDVLNKEKENKIQKDKANKNKKTGKPKPVEIDVKLKFEDSSTNPITPNNLSSNTSQNLKTKYQKEEKAKNKQKETVIKEENTLANSIYTSKTTETKIIEPTQTITLTNIENKNIIENNPIEIETIKILHEDNSIYNNKNFGYDQTYYNSGYDYYGTGNKSNASAGNRKNNNKKKHVANSNENNDFYEYENQYEYDEVYGNKNYQGGNKNYYQNYSYNSKHGNRGNKNYDY